MTIIAYLDVDTGPGDNPIDVRDRAAEVIERAGLHCKAVEVVAETGIITKIPEVGRSRRP